jgi:hypothetical protein
VKGKVAFFSVALRIQNSKELPFLLRGKVAKGSEHARVERSLLENHNHRQSGSDRSQ